MCGASVYHEFYCTCTCTCTITVIVTITMHMHDSDSKSKIYDMHTVHTIGVVYFKLWKFMEFIISSKLINIIHIIYKPFKKNQNLYDKLCLINYLTKRYTK